MKSDDIQRYLSKVERGHGLSIDEQRLVLDSLRRAHGRLLSYRQSFGALPLQGDAGVAAAGGSSSPTLLARSHD